MVRHWIRVCAIAIATVLIAATSTITPANAAEAKIARITIVSASGGTSSSSTAGHSFLLVKNISSNQNIVVGVLGLSKNETISIGTWGNLSDGKGIYYNYELYIGASGFPGRVSYTVDITSSQLAKINDYIRNNNSWSVLDNCAMFASMAWYQAIRPAPSGGSPVTPTGLVSGIKKISGYKTNIAMPTKKKGEVLRQDGKNSYHVAKI